MKTACLIACAFSLAVFTQGIAVPESRTPILRAPLEVGPVVPSPDLLKSWMESLFVTPIEESDPISTIVYKLARAGKAFAERELDRIGAFDPSMDARAMLSGAVHADNDAPYFGFIPNLSARILPGKTITWSGECFKNMEATATIADGDLNVELKASNKRNLLCTETMLLGTVAQYHVQELVLPGSKSIKMANPNSTAEVWDLNNNGIRVFTFVGSLQTILGDIVATAELFEPEATKPVGPISASKNLDFLQRYRGLTMEKRAVTDVILNETDIHSGDFFGVIRLDGLDPMLAWAMGATTGHTTVALWDAGQLYVCESTAVGSYWDVNGIQKTPYREWLAKAKAASFNVVHLPLAKQYREIFNETAAWEFFNSAEGFDYGYNNMLWGWVDTPVKNYPCLPPDYNRCLSWEIIEVIFPVISKYVTKFESFYDQAFNKRLGTEGLSFPELLQEASQRGMDAHMIPTIVEQDAWSYNTTRNGVVAQGPSMVCCVFVCHIWKSAGLFASIDNEINCGELTNWDDYSMALYDPEYVRPQACVDADPNNNVCQLLGDYSITVNNYNSKPMYKHMAENCPGVAPDYSRPDNC